MQNSRNAQISDVKASRVLFEFLVNQKIVNRTIFLTINRLVNSHFFAALKNIALSCNDCSNMPHLCDACCAAEKRKNVLSLGYIMVILRAGLLYLSFHATVC